MHLLVNNTIPIYAQSRLLGVYFITEESIAKVYTSLKKRCREKCVNDGQCDTTELWEDGTGKFVTGFCFLIFKIFSFQDNLKNKLRHAGLL